MRRSKGFVSGFAAFILSFVITCCICAFISIFSLEGLVSEDNIKKVIAKDPIVLEQGTSYLEVLGLPEDTMQEIVNTEEMKNFVSEYVSGIAEYLLHEGDEPSIEAGDIASVTMASLNEMEEKSGVSLSDAQKQIMEQLVAVYSEQVAAKLPTAKTIEDGMDPVLLSNIRIFFSPMLKVALAITILCMLVLIGIVRGELSDLVKWSGIAFILAGLASILFGFGGEAFTSWLMEGQDLMGTLLTAAGDTIFWTWKCAGAGCMLAGIICLVISGKMQRNSRGRISRR